jgi:hypothetical protein
MPTTRKNLAPDPWRDRYKDRSLFPERPCRSAVHHDEVMDLAASCVAFLTAHGVVRAAAIANALFPQSTRGFLEGGVATQEMLAKMLEGSVLKAEMTAQPKHII